jgi:hypothetical protein
LQLLHAAPSLQPQACPQLPLTQDRPAAHWELAVHVLRTPPEQAPASQLLQMLRSTTKPWLHVTRVLPEHPMPASPAHDGSVAGSSEHRAHVGGSAIPTGAFVWQSAALPQAAKGSQVFGLRE